jgi:hypothetical protein
MIAQIRSQMWAPCVAMSLLAGGLYGSPAASADRPDLLSDPFIFSLGTYVINDETRLRVDGKDGELGTPINWSRTFGGGDLTRFRMAAQWRFAERHKLRALWFNSDRSETKTIDREIDWGGEIFPVNAKVKAAVKYSIYQLTYEYSLLRRDSWELSANIGAYYAQYNSKLAATVTEPDGVTQRNAKSDASLDVPLPVLGLRGQWMLPYDLWLDLEGQWFAITLNGYSGNLQDYRGMVMWQPKKWFGIGAGYDWFSAHGDTDADHFKGNLDWTFQGPMVYYIVSF